MHMYRGMPPLERSRKFIARMCGFWKYPKGSLIVYSRSDACMYVCMHACGCGYGCVGIEQQAEK
ncbi:hypothetical protein BJX99DRAFT_95628 [Aspergillus californicus]